MLAYASELEAYAAARASTRSDLVYRELSVAEWNLLKTMPPFDVKATPNPSAARVIVAQDNETGKLVAYWFVVTIVHVEPAWIDPEYRHKPTLVRKLWESTRRLLDSIGVSRAFCTINYDAPRENASMAQRLGFKRLPTDLYLLELEEKEKEKEK